jgi:hypothetical protein
MKTGWVSACIWSVPQLMSVAVNCCEWELWKHTYRMFLIEIFLHVFFFGGGGSDKYTQRNFMVCLVSKHERWWTDSFRCHVEAPCLSTCLQVRL